MTTPMPNSANIVSTTAWQRAYCLSVLNALTFFFLSLLAYLLSFDDAVTNVLIPLGFFFGSVVGFYLLVSSGGELAAISYFVLGSGIFLGFGSAYAGVLGEEWLTALSGASSQIIPKVNFVNSVSVLVVLLTAWSLSRRQSKRLGVDGVLAAVNQLAALSGFLLCVSAVIVSLQIMLFPIPANLIVRAILSHLQVVPSLSLVLAGMRWSKLGAGGKLVRAVLCLAMVGYGILSLSKYSALFPILALTFGMTLDRASRPRLYVLLALSIAAYFVVIGPICNNGRNHPAYEPATNTIDDRVNIVLETWISLSDDRDGQQASGNSAALLSRFSGTPVQAFLIEGYDNGTPGNSLQDAFSALIPRLLWPDKPNITRFGAELDMLFNDRTETGSNLAPVFSTEAYWNYGWMGVIVSSLLIGLEIAWFTNKWARFARGGENEMGVFVVAVPIIALSGWVETWIVPTFVGGFATLFVFVKSVDYVFPLFVKGLSSRARSPLL